MSINKSDYKIIDRIISEYSEYEFSNCNKDELAKEIIQQESVNNNISSGNYNYGKIQWWYQNGLDEMGTRHKVSLLIAMYLKGEGFSSNEAFDKLLIWSLKQVERGFSCSSDHEIQKDIKNILDKSVYNKSRKYNLSHNDSEVLFSRTEMKAFVELNSIAKDTGKKMLTLQKMLFAMMVHNKRHGNVGEEFYMTYDQLMETTGVGSRSTVKICIDDLEKYGFIEIVSRNISESKDSKVNLPNKYRLDCADISAIGQEFKVCNRKVLCNNCFYCMLNYFYDKDDINKVVTRSVKSKVLSCKDKCDYNDKGKLDSYCIETVKAQVHIV